MFEKWLKNVPTEMKKCRLECTSLSGISLFVGLILDRH